MRRAVAAALDRDAVLSPGERVLVACSGGPDSSILVDALARLAPPRRLELFVAHVDHGLRPGSAAEAEIVRRLAEERGLPFLAMTASVSTQRGSLQDRARQARHAALRSAADSVGATAIALGHTADDQAETVLMRALTGASPRALQAMSPREGPLARPLLGLWRADVLACCDALGLQPLEDPSNLDRRHLRSRVRHDLLPALEAVFPAARRRLVVLAERERAAATASRNGDAAKAEEKPDARLRHP